MFKTLGRALKTWRVGRVVMMALVTGSTAYGFGGSSKQVILAGLTA